MKVEDAHLEDSYQSIEFMHNDDYCSQIKEIYNNSTSFKRLLNAAIKDITQEREADEKSTTLDYQRKLTVTSKSAQEALESLSRTHPEFERLIKGRMKFCDFRTFIEGYETILKNPATTNKAFIRKLGTLFNHLIKTREINYREHNAFTIGLIETNY
jgi:hypothetical protein